MEQDHESNKSRASSSSRVSDACTKCNGAGETRDAVFDFRFIFECSECDGTGKLVDQVTKRLQGENTNPNNNAFIGFVPETDFTPGDPKNG